MISMRRVRASIGVSSIAIALTSLSVLYERPTDDRAVTGNVCGPAANEQCVERRLGAGFPLAFLYDRPSISVPGSIHVVEDEFQATPFVLNILIYFAILLLTFRLIELRRGRPAFEPVERPAAAGGSAYRTELAPPDR